MCKISLDSLKLKVLVLALGYFYQNTPFHIFFINIIDRYWMVQKNTNAKSCFMNIKAIN